MLSRFYSTLIMMFAVNSFSFASEFHLDGYQFPDGAISIFKHGDNVDPYFASKALLVAHDAGLDISKVAEPWIAWGLQHQRKDGGFDRYCRKGESLAACSGADADDAVAAVWIELLAKLATKSAQPLPISWQESIARAFSLLDSLHDKHSNIYFISTSQPVGLLMDNIEVYTALLAMSQLKHHSGDTQTALVFASQANHLANSIYRVFWQPCTQKLRVSTQLQAKSSFYPDQVAEIFPILAKMPIPGRDEAVFFDNWLIANREQWFRLAAIDFPWGLVAIAAEQLQHNDIVRCWLELGKKLRTTNHWNILEEATYASLEAKVTKLTYLNTAICPILNDKNLSPVNQLKVPENVHTANIDKTPPSNPEELTQVSVSHDAVKLAWKPSKDNFSQISYQILRNGAEIGVTKDLHYSDSCVSPITTYQYSIRAVDDANNLSLPSNQLVVTTLVK